MEPGVCKPKYANIQPWNVEKPRNWQFPQRAPAGRGRAPWRPCPPRTRSRRWKSAGTESQRCSFLSPDTAPESPASSALPRRGCYILSPTLTPAVTIECSLNCGSLIQLPRPWTDTVPSQREGAGDHHQLVQLSKYLHFILLLTRATTGLLVLSY